MLNRRRGGNAAEFALIAPVLVTVIIGVMEYGWFLSVNQAAVMAAREGARVGSLAGDSAVAAQVAGQTLTENGLDSDEAVINCPISTDTGTDVSTITCSVQYTAGGLTNLVPVPTNASGSISYRVE